MATASTGFKGRNRRDAPPFSSPKLSNPFSSPLLSTSHVEEGRPAVTLPVSCLSLPSAAVCPSSVWQPCLRQRLHQNVHPSGYDHTHRYKHTQAHRHTLSVSHTRTMAGRGRNLPWNLISEGHVGEWGTD